MCAALHHVHLWHRCNWWSSVAFNRYVFCLQSAGPTRPGWYQSQAEIWRFRSFCIRWTSVGNPPALKWQCSRSTVRAASPLPLLHWFHSASRSAVAKESGNWGNPIKSLAMPLATYWDKCYCCNNWMSLIWEESAEWRVQRGNLFFFFYPEVDAVTGTGRSLDPNPESSQLVGWKQLQ